MNYCICNLEIVMKTIKLLAKLSAGTLILGLLLQPAMAQDEAAMVAMKQVADIVASLNHFPTDEDKTALADISGNENLPESLRDMADTVANISHAATDEGKAMMADIQASDEATESAKALAGIIADINHSASDDAKATLTAMFP